MCVCVCWHVRWQNSLCALYKGFTHARAHTTTHTLTHTCGCTHFRRPRTWHSTHTAQHRCRSIESVFVVKVAPAPKPLLMRVHTDLLEPSLGSDGEAKRRAPPDGDPHCCRIVGRSLIMSSVWFRCVLRV